MIGKGVVPDESRPGAELFLHSWLPRSTACLAQKPEVSLISDVTVTSQH